jgi:biotin synthase-like enzyme
MSCDCPRTGSMMLWLSPIRFACGGVDRTDVEVEGIVSLKTGGCPEDCHFCSRSRRSGSRCLIPCLRFAGGRELTLGDLGARQGMLGGINAVIVGNYLTTLGRDPAELALLAELAMPVKALSATL